MCYITADHMWWLKIYSAWHGLSHMKSYARVMHPFYIKQTVTFSSKMQLCGSLCIISFALYKIQ